MKKFDFKFWQLSVLALILLSIRSNAQEDIGVTTISNPNGIVCSLSFSAIVTIENFGANDVTSADILYNIDGGANSTKSWVGTLTPGGTVDLVITGLSSTEGAHTFNATSDLPNGAVDVNLTNDAASSNFTISTPITYSSSIINATCGNDDGSIEITASGGAGTLQYSSDGGNTFQAGNVFSGLGLNQYTVVVEDANGCRKMTNETVLADGGPSISTINDNDPLCYNDNSGFMVVAATGTSLTYSKNGGQTYQSSPLFSNLTAGFYSVFVKDNAGCETFQNVTLTNPDQITTIVFGNDASCNATNGSTSIIANGGAGSFTYQWDDPSNQTTPSAANLGVGFYHVTVTDGNDCSVQDSVYINNTNGPQVTITSTDVLCNGEGSGTALANVAGGTPPYLFQWNDGANQTTQTATNLTIGSYDVVATDVNGCEGVGSTNIGEPTTVVGSMSGYNTSCGENNGVGVIQLIGGTSPYTYLWDVSVNDTNATILNLEAGTYTVEAWDANNCLYTDSIEILGSEKMVITDSVNHESCAGMNDGSMLISVSGGVLPYEILWSTGATDTLVENIGSGQYSLEVTDADGCVIESQLSIVTESSECVIIPTAFSPNNDGKNDFFVLEGIENGKAVSIEIFNRWGDIVYQNVDYQNDWDGQLSGKDLPAGSYHCIIMVEEENQYMGPITILR